jgi:hypothetical protein
MKQLVTFLHELGPDDRQIRADAIELSAAPADAGAERWSATVTLALRPQASSDR